MYGATLGNHRYNFSNLATLLAKAIVLDSLSERQGQQGLDREFWGKELVEKGDYLGGTCGGEDFSERVKAKSEQRPGAAAMLLDGNGMQARHGDAGFDGERHGESHEREQGAQFVRVGEVRGLHLRRAHHSRSSNQACGDPTDHHHDCRNCVDKNPDPARA